MSRRRAGVLILIHVLAALHIAQWLIQGRTVSPVEPSESMRTLELGQVNAGALFFSAAILGTLIFGRFFCGWGCHVVALQDLCGWLMKRCGIRPRLFRSRLLAYVPLTFAFYMFLWPTLKRVAIVPLLESAWPEALTYLGGAPAFPGFTNHLIEQDFWQTFPSIAVAIPFFGICGFVIVYLLGAKGFCTYGCPYGGVFGPVDRISPGRILVDLNSCERCGHCTATCTSNVRVHEEIQVHGMVVDNGCMKCLDCVSVCPNDALSFGFGRPSLLKKRSPAARSKSSRPVGRVYDLTLGEEIVVASVFLGTFLAVRGAYQIIPMLMALGIAPCMAFCTWKSWRIFRGTDVQIHRFIFKKNGRWTHVGRTFAAGTGILIFLVLHTGIVRYHTVRGDLEDRRVRVSKEAAFAQFATPLPREAVEHAEKALEHLRKVRPLTQGGWGLLATPGLTVREAWLSLVAGQTEEAESLLRQELDKRGVDHGLAADLGRLLLLQDRGPEAIELYGSLVGRAPEDAPLRAHLGSLYLSSGQLELALKELERAAELAPENPNILHDLATALLLGGQGERALGEMEKAASLAPNDPQIQEHLQTLRDSMPDTP